MRALMAMLMLLAALFAAGCSSDPAKPAAGAEPASGSAAAPAKADFEVREIDAAGMKALLAENPDTAFLLCFWSVNCPACEQEIPELEKLADAYAGDNLRILLVNLDPQPAMVKAYFGEHTPVTEQYHGANDLAEAYGVYAIPHLVLHKAGGDVFFNKSGYFPAKMLEAIIEHGISGGSAQ